MSNDSIYLSAASLRNLSSLPGVTIGAHGYSHCRLINCNDEELKNELDNSKKWLENCLSLSVNTMSYPHGSINQKVKDYAKLAGFKIACTSQFGTNNLSSDFLSLKRTDIWANDKQSIFNSKIRGDWDWMRWV